MWETGGEQDMMPQAGQMISSSFPSSSSSRSYKSTRRWPPNMHASPREAVIHIIHTQSKNLSPFTRTKDREIVALTIYLHIKVNQSSVSSVRVRIIPLTANGGTASGRETARTLPSFRPMGNTAPCPPQTQNQTYLHSFKFQGLQHCVERADSWSKGMTRMRGWNLKLEALRLTSAEQTCNNDWCCRVEIVCKNGINPKSSRCKSIKYVWGGFPLSWASFLTNNTSCLSCN